MDIQEYYGIRESIAILGGIQTKQEWVRQILEVYPNLSEMKLSEVKQWLSDRAADFEVQIQDEMGVRKNSLTARNKCGIPSL